MPTVAVVGATGFLGGHVARALRDAGHQVLSLSRSSAGGRDAAWRRLPTDPPALRRLLLGESAVAVINCAGATHGSKADLGAANVALVASLLAALDDSDVRFVQLGSAAEYGPGEIGRATREDDVASPVGDYGISKLAATGLVLAAAERADVPGLVLRVFNPLGPGISPESLPGRAAREIRHALAGGRAVHLGPLDATRDFVDVRDMADAVAVASLATDLTGRVLNIGSGRAVTAREMVQLLSEVAGYSGPILEHRGGSPRSEATDWQVADIRAAASALGWVPRRSLRDALTALWEAG